MTQRKRRPPHGAGIILASLVSLAVIAAAWGWRQYRTWAHAEAIRRTEASVLQGPSFDAPADSTAAATPKQGWWELQPDLKYLNSRHQQMWVPVPEGSDYIRWDVRWNGGRGPRFVSEEWMAANSDTMANPSAPDTMISLGGSR